MSALIGTANTLQNILDKFRGLDFLGPLALRLYLAPVFIAAGLTKLSGIDNFAGWLGNADWA